MHIHIYTYIHLCIYTYIHMHIYLHTQMPTYIYTYIRIYIYTYIHIYIYTYIHIYIYISLYILRSNTPLGMIQLTQLVDPGVLVISHCIFFLINLHNWSSYCLVSQSVKLFVSQFVWLLVSLLVRSFRR